ncbi:MAG: PaaX family transcriptional regulator C-terminal domain-containing protein [Propionibacteriaceae bacterium]
MTGHRYRYSVKSLDVGFVFGALGAIALPGPVLLIMLDAVGTAESAARNLLTTSTARGMLISHRSGRYAVYQLSPASLAGYQRVAGTAAEVGWSGRFHALIYDVPEKHRAIRDRIRYAADYAGYGLLRAGVLISPEDRRERFSGLLGGLPAGCRMYAATVQPEDLSAARAMTRDAWDLEALAGQYRDANDRLRATDATLPDTCWSGLTRWHALYRRLLALQLSDPALPPELLPARWPGRGFVEALDHLNRRWGPQLQPALRAEAATADPAGLAVYYPSPWTT